MKRPCGRFTPRTKNLEGALQMEKEVGLPLIIRPSFTLGGQGGAIAYTHEDLVKRVFTADAPDRVWFTDIQCRRRHWMSPT